jgi:hypothetical protein
LLSFVSQRSTDLNLSISLTIIPAFLDCLDEKYQKSPRPIAYLVQLHAENRAIKEFEGHILKVAEH